MLLFFLVIVAIVAVGGTLIWALHDVPLLAAPQEPQSYPIVFETADGKPFARKGTVRAPDAKREDYPSVLVNAVTSIEDRRFFKHFGIDPYGVVRAAHTNLFAGQIVQGGSTITQQLVKVLLHDDERTFTRKLREAIVSLWLERQLSKDEILTRYLNSVYLGGGAVGMPTAARMLFGKPVSDLSLPEAAMLAGLIRSPSQLWPLKNFDGAKARADVVLDAMVAAGTIDQAAADSAKLHPATLKLDDAPTATGSWFGDWAFQQATDVTGTFSGPMRVRTTLDPRLQAIAEAAVRNGLAGPGKTAGVSQGALVAMRPDGAVVAMVGGLDYGQSVFNRAVQAKRQPGSAFKLFVYLAALRRGFTPNDVVDDTPLDVDGWKPANFDGRFHGRVTLADAFANSYNVAAARLAMEAGIDQVIAAAHDLGIAVPLGKNPSIALGTSEVSLLDLTSAYAAVRAGTMPVRPWGISGFGAEQQSQLFPSGAPSGPKRSLEPYRGPLIELLQQVVLRGTGHAAQLPGFAAGKTGTSQNHRDAWFIGFNDGLVVGVWVGNDDDKPMNDVVGGSIPAMIWKEFQTRAGAVAVAGAAPAAPGAQPGDTVTAGAPPALPTGDAAPGPGVDQSETASIGDNGTGGLTPLAPSAGGGRCNPFACARTYRSFRLSDCTYQPYDGSPRRICEKGMGTGGAPPVSAADGQADEPPPSSGLADVGEPAPAQQPREKANPIMSSEQPRAEATCGRVHMRVAWTNNGRSWRCVK